MPWHPGGPPQGHQGAARAASLKARLQTLCTLTPRLLLLCAKETAVNPLRSVYTSWPYYSRVNIKAPDGINTKAIAGLQLLRGFGFGSSNTAVFYFFVFVGAA